MQLRRQKFLGIQATNLLKKNCNYAYLIHYFNKIMGAHCVPLRFATELE